MYNYIYHDIYICYIYRCIFVCKNTLLYKNILLLDLFCAFLTMGCDLILPMILRFLANEGTENLASITIQLIFKLSAIYLILRIIDSIANYYMTRIGHVMGARIETDMRKDAFNHIQKLSDSYF